MGESRAGNNWPWTASLVLSGAGFRVFLERRPCNAWCNSDRSAYMRLSRPFSASNSLSRRSYETSMPPYCPVQR